MFAQCLKSTISLRALSIAAAALAATTLPAAAAGKLNKLEFKTTSAYNQVIRVVSTDKKRWDKIVLSNVHFFAEMDLAGSLAPHTRISRVGISFGHCGASCATDPLLFHETAINNRTYKKSRNVTLDISHIKTSSPQGIATQPYGDDILSRCNQHLSANGPTNGHSFDYTLHASLLVSSYVVGTMSMAGTGSSTHWGATPHHNTTKPFQVRVVCEPAMVSPVGDVAAAEPDFTVKGITARLITSALKPHQPNPATRCQVTTARVRVATSKAGPVKFLLWSKLGGEAAQSQLVEAWSSHKGPGKYEAVFDKAIKVDKTTQVQIMAEDMTNPVGQTSGWKSSTLHCSGAGGGGLTVGPGPNNPDNRIPTPPLQVTGAISYGEKPGSVQNQPRDAIVNFRLWANKSGTTSYRLTCSGGHEWTGTVATNAVGGGKYQGSAMKSVHIDKTTDLGCVLRSTSMSGNPVVAVGTRKYVVIKRNPNIAGPGGVSTGSQPTHAPKRAPVAQPLRIIPKADTHLPHPHVRPQRKEVQQEQRRPGDLVRQRTSSAEPSTSVQRGSAHGAQQTGARTRFDIRKPH